MLVTGGAGFIGRWVVKELLTRGHQVLVLDNLSNGSEENLAEFAREKRLDLEIGEIRDETKREKVFAAKPRLCLHLAASINVQDSLKHPQETFSNDVVGTFNVLEACRKRRVHLVYVSTCMVYAPCTPGTAIHEEHPVRPASPYAGAKLAGENMVFSYGLGYGLPVVVLRPFNTYGPYQKATGEGGVISIFLARALEGKPLQIYGDGTQTRDFLYVEDCASFIVEAALNEAATGKIINAGTGRSLSINALAEKVGEVAAPGQGICVQHVPHIHPQSEIFELCCDYRRAQRLLQWEPQVSLDEGLRRTAQWLKDNFKT